MQAKYLLWPTFACPDAQSSDFVPARKTGASKPVANSSEPGTGRSPFSSLQVPAGFLLHLDESAKEWVNFLYAHIDHGADGFMQELVGGACDLKGIHFWDC